VYICYLCLYLLYIYIYFSIYYNCLCTYICHGALWQIKITYSPKTEIRDVMETGPPFWNSEKLGKPYTFAVTEIDDIGWPWAAIKSNLLRISWILQIWEATTAKRMKVDTHCQRQLCKLLNVLFSIMFLMRWFCCRGFAIVPSYTHCCRALTLAFS